MNADEDPGLKRLEIKKYANRRYYDTTHSRHLTLEEIRALVQKGHDIRVVDAKTSTDITAQVLTQIILELETPKLDSFPVSLLLRLIRVNDSMVKDFIEKYFNQAFQTFLDYQKRYEAQLRQAHGLPAPFPDLPDWTKSMFNPFAAMTGAPTPDASPGAEDTKTLLTMIQDLQKEIAALKPSHRKRPAPRKKPRATPAKPRSSRRKS